MFDIFEKMMQSGEKIIFTIEKKNDKLAVLVQSQLNGKSDDLTSELGSLRAAISMPLYVVASADELNNEFPEGLAEFASARESSKSALETALARHKKSSESAVRKLPGETSSSSTANSSNIASSKDNQSGKRGRPRKRAITHTIDHESGDIRAEEVGMESFDTVD